jgi:mRNA interferase RelE/StbE
VLYDLEVSPAAARQIKKLDRFTQTRVAKRLRALREDPRPRDVKKLSGGTDLYRVRVGDYRILYRIADERLIVVVIRIGHRRDVYEGL